MYVKWGATRVGAHKVIASIVAVLIAAGVVTAERPAAAAAPTITPVRQVGAPGHAALYGWGAATFPDGTVAIGDYWNYRVQRYAKDGTLLGTVVPRTSTIPHGAPYGLGVDPVTGDLYMGDPDLGGTVDKYTMTGTPILQFGASGQGPGKFVYPRGVAVTSDRRVYVTDARDNTISAHTPDGNELYAYSGGQSPNPRSIGVDASDLLYVGDSLLGKVVVFDKELRPIRSFGAGMFGADIRGLAVDKANGWVYVVDPGSRGVFKFTTSGTFLLKWTFTGGIAGQIDGGGRDLTVDGDGNVWVGDMPNFRAQKFSPTGQLLFEVPTTPGPPPDGGFAEPRDVTVDGQGNVVVVDTHNWRLQRFGPTGTFLNKWGNRSVLNYPKGAFADRGTGSVYVCDTDGNKLRKFSPTGAFLWTVQGYKCFGGTVAADGATVYVADTYNGRVVQLGASDGALVRTIATKGNGNGQVQSPYDVALDTDGSIWVSDRQRNVVQHFGAAGGYLGQVGQPGGGATGLGLSWGVAVADGHVLVSDAATDSIKMWTTAGAYAGTFGGKGTQLGEFTGLRGIDAYGAKLYTVEQGNERVQVFDVGQVAPPPVDTTPPDATVTSPQQGQAMSGGTVTISGTATDEVGVATVKVAVRDNVTLQWWTGTGWGAFTQFDATLAQPGARSTGWTLDWPAQVSGRYGIQVRTDDAAGNTDPTRPWVSFRVV